MGSAVPVRTLLVATHPSQYGAPLFRAYAEHPDLDLTVAYLSLRGAERAHDPGFDTDIAWDVPLLEGYDWINPPNRSPLTRPGSLWSAINPALWSHVRRTRHDVVICQGYRRASFWIAALAAKTSGGSLLFTTDAHTLRPRGGQRWKLPLKKVLVPRILGWADGVVTPSTRGRRFLLDLGLPPERVHLAPYVVDNQFFASRAAQADRAARRRGWAIDEATPAALFCGKLVAWKRPQDPIRAIARTKDVHLVVAGEGPLRRSLEDLAEQLGVSDRVRFLGFINQTDLPEIYAAADVLVLPSEFEPFGLVVNEAFACGTPAVVTDACGSADDLIIEGQTGFVVPTGDIEVLAVRLRQASLPEVSGRLGQAARARITDWGYDQNVTAIVRTCRALTGRTQRAHAVDGGSTPGGGDPTGRRGTAGQ